MKNIPLAIVTLIIASSAPAGAAPWDIFRKKPEPPRHEDRHDRGPRPGHDHRHHGDRDHRRPRLSLEARVQIRLRELGFYRGPIDGSLGRVSRAALSRFQHTRGLRPTGVLNEPTIRALRL